MIHISIATAVQGKRGCADRVKFPVHCFAPQRVKILPVELPTKHQQIGVITLKNRTLSPLAQLFIECAREFVTALVKRK